MSEVHSETGPRPQGGDAPADVGGEQRDWTSTMITFLSGTGTMDDPNHEAPGKPMGV